MATCGVGLSLASQQAASTAFNDKVWQIDPTKCTQCGRCATECVLDVSAVKCVHDLTMCGYCRLCFGFFTQAPITFDSGAENQTCPTGAIKRRFIEEPYHEYLIEESLCIGCSKCVKGCKAFGNGSLYLQIRHDRCVNCNICRIAIQCPSEAFIKVSAGDANIIQSKWLERKS